MTNTEQPQATVWLITTWSRETGNTKVIGIVRNHTEALQALKGYMWPHLKYGTGAMNMDATQLSSFRKTWNDGCPFKLISAWNGHRLGLYIELVEHRLGLTDAAKLLVQCPI